MRRSAALLCLFFALEARGDIPDHTASWRSFEVASGIGSDFVVKSAREADYSGFHSVVFNSNGESWNWSLLSMNRYGKVTGRALLLSDQGELEHWFTPCFIDGMTLCAVYGSRLGPGPATLLTLNCRDPEDRSEVELAGPLAFYDEISLTSLEHLEDGGFLTSGAGYSEAGGTAFFTGEIAEDGTVVWLRELPEYEYLQLEDTTLEILRDGSFMLSFEEDAFASGVAVARLDARGSESWKTFVELDCEFTAVVNDFLELENGDILCAGTFDQLGTMTLRGILVLFDPALEEIWKRIDWYNDYTEFTSLELTEENKILCAGWTGTSAQNIFQAEDMNVLFAFVDAPGNSIYAIEIEEEGNQRPCAVFEGGFGEYFVLGECSPEGGGDSDVFFGRVLLDR